MSEAKKQRNFIKLAEVRLDRINFLMELLTKPEDPESEPATSDRARRMRQANIRYQILEIERLSQKYDENDEDVLRQLWYRGVAIIEAQEKGWKF